MSRNYYLDGSEDMPDDEGIPDFPEADISGFPEEDTPAGPIPSQASRFLSSPGSQRPAPPQNSMPGWDMAKTMCKAGGRCARRLGITCDPSLCKQRDHSQTIEDTPRMYLKTSKYFYFVFIISKNI